jgi:tetratricopeptide (TPR) repeat protein
LDEVSRLAALISKIQDPEKRADATLMFVISLAASGKSDAAIRVAETLDNDRTTIPETRRSVGSRRNRAFYMVSRFQSLSHDFAAAKETIRRIDDPEVVSSAWLRVAENQAKAGQYEEALVSLGKVAVTSDDSRQAKEETRKLIAKCKAEGCKDAPRKRSQGFIAALRKASTIFGDVHVELDDLTRAEQSAQKMKGPLNRAAAWRQIAWAHYEKKDAIRCRRAIQKSLENADAVPGPLAYQRRITYVAMADLYLELGDVESARQLIQKANSVHLDADFFGGLNAFTTTPLLISVLVRSGDVQGAITTVERIHEKEADMAWLTLAIVCALEGKAGCIERKLESVGSERVKALLCAGVAVGLNERRKQQAVK